MCLFLITRTYICTYRDICQELYVPYDGCKARSSRGLTTRYLERDLVYGLPGGGSSLAPPLFSTSRSLTFLSCHGLCIVPRIRRYADNLTQKPAVAPRSFRVLLRMFERLVSYE